LLNYYLAEINLFVSCGELVLDPFTLAELLKLLNRFGVKNEERKVELVLFSSLGGEL